MHRVTGLGGFFFRAKDPQALSDWYEEHFGIGAIGRQEIWWQESGPTVFAPFPADTDYFGRADQPFMINFRVTGLDALLEQLRLAGVRIDEKRMKEPYGRFAWVYDIEGNKIELWEPKDQDAPASPDVA